MIGRAAGVLWTLILLTGCAGTPVTDSLRQSPPPDLPPAVELTDTPFFAQTDFQCGPATLAAALNATGLATTPDGISGQLYTPGREGSLQADLVTAARRNARLPVPVDGMIGAMREVAAGRPVVILQNLGLDFAPQWHYALLVGYDLSTQEAILRSGTEPRMVIPLKTLEYTWARGDFWGVMVTRPEGPIPQTASRSDWLVEAAGVERAGHRPEATQAYRAAVARWPQDATPYVALANALYAGTDLAGAERALRQAVAVAPNNTLALNNLAHVLLKNGRVDEAEEMAERAIAQDDAQKPAATRTLVEIRAYRDLNRAKEKVAPSPERPRAS